VEAGNVASAVKTIVGVLVAAVVAVAGLGVGVLGWLRGGSDELGSYDYVAVPPVAAGQYAFPEEGAVSSAHPLLAYGTQIDVLCAVRRRDGRVDWVKLVEGTYLRAEDVTPSATEDGPRDQLPSCD
jgi:hypothetical protein